MKMFAQKCTRNNNLRDIEIKP